MQTVLFHQTIFGPISSRRLGVSLGVNLLPNDGKICSFDCVYCEAGYNAQGQGTTGVPTRKQVKTRLRDKLRAMTEAGEALDTITFSGNGEPTLHPEFPQIVRDTLSLRDQYYPAAKVSVLSNASMLHLPKVVEALKSVDNNILKLDSAISPTLRRINRPVSTRVQPEGLIEDLKAFGGQCVVQTMMLRGSHDGSKFDNTTDEEIAALAEAYRVIRPRLVMVYAADRATPEEDVEKIGLDELRAIGQKLERDSGIPVQVNA